MGDGPVLAGPAGGGKSTLLDQTAKWKEGVVHGECVDDGTGKHYLVIDEAHKLHNKDAVLVIDEAAKCFGKGPSDSDGLINNLKRFSRRILFVTTP